MREIARVVSQPRADRPMDEKSAGGMKPPSASNKRKGRADLAWLAPMFVQRAAKSTLREDLWSNSARIAEKLEVHDETFAVLFHVCGSMLIGKRDDVFWRYVICPDYDRRALELNGVTDAEPVEAR